MAINPTLVIGVGDAGAYAIASAKQRFQSLLGPEMPGIAYYAVISDTSDAAMQSGRIDGTLKSNLSRMAARAMSRGSSVSSLQAAPGILGSAWLGGRGSDDPLLLTELSANPDAALDCIRDVRRQLDILSSEASPAEYREILSNLRYLVNEAVLRRARAKAKSFGQSERTYDSFLEASERLLSIIESALREADAACKAVLTVPQQRDDLPFASFNRFSLVKAVRSTVEQIAQVSQAISRGVVSALGGVSGIAKDPVAFGRVLDGESGTWLADTLPKKVLRFEVSGLPGTPLQELEDGEFVKLESGVQKGHEQGRVDVRNALLVSDTFQRVTVDLKSIIDNLSEPSTIVRMEEQTKSLGIDVDSSTIRITIVADLGDCVGGAIHNEVAAQLQQICEKAGYHAAVTGLFLVPPLLAGVGTVEMSLAPARAYASLKETYHWQDLGKYELVGPDGVHISADTALFSNIYLIQRRGIDAAEQARLLSTPIADFLVMHVLDEERQIDGTFDALPPHVRHPINSPGTSRLHYPERTLTMYRSLWTACAIAGKVEQGAKGCPSKENGEDEPIWERSEALDDIISKWHKEEASEEVWLDLAEWLKELDDKVAGILDSGPIEERFDRSRRLVTKMQDKVNQRLPATLIEEFTKLASDRDSLHARIEGSDSMTKKCSGHFARSGVLGITSLAALATPISTMLWPTVLPSLGVLLTSLAPWGLVGGVAVSLGTGLFARGQFLKGKKLRDEGKKLHADLTSVKQRLEPLMNPHKYAFVHLLLLKLQLGAMLSQIDQLESSLIDARDQWERERQALEKSLNFGGPVPDEAGQITLLTEGFLSQWSKKTEDELLTPSCPIQFSGMLGATPAAVIDEFPEQVLDAVDTHGPPDWPTSVVSAMDYMGRSGEDMVAFAKSLRFAAEPKLKLNQAKDMVTSKTLLSLRNKGVTAVSSSSLMANLNSAGVGKLHSIEGTDASSIAMCRILDRAVNVEAILMLQDYYQAYLRVTPTGRVTADPASHERGVMKDISDAPNEGLSKKTMVQALALDILQPPHMPRYEGTALNRSGGAGPWAGSPYTSKGLLTALDGDPGRRSTLARLIADTCNTDNRANLIAWLEWVCKTKAWWSDVLDLVAPDLAYVHMLINDLKAGKEIEVSL